MAREFTVLVTGFGANLNAPGGNSTSNPAGLVAGMMPKELAPQHAFNSSNARINILDSVAGQFDAIPGENRVIRRRIQELHAEYGSKVDLWIHLGRAPWDFVTCERLAFRQDFTSSWLTEEQHKAYYLGRDNVGESVHDLGPCPWTEVPMGLDTEIDVNAVVPEANKGLVAHHQATQDMATPLQVRSHLEAGPLGCGFCFYESMANCFVQRRKRNVLFVHVPPDVDQVNLERARDAVLAIIGAATATLISKETTPVDWKDHFSSFR